jgi:hypothetical protein
MDFGLESSQLVHPFSSQREFALRIVACELCAAAAAALRRAATQNWTQKTH